MAPTAASQRWLSGPFLDLFLGCGLIYCVAFAGLVAAGPQMREVLPLELTPLIVLVTGIPHYGATLLRAYEHASDRRRYAFFTLWMTLLVWGLFAVGVYEHAVGSVLLTVYLTWSPWHYSGQNYGIAMMFLRRRGAEITALRKRLFQGSFFLSFVLTFLAFHGAGPDALYAPLEYERSVYRLIPLGIPHAAVQVLIPLCLGAYLVCLIGSLAGFKRGASWSDLLPAALLAGSQALWFTVPMLARHAGVLQGLEPFGTEHATYAFLWIAVAHATQYVWITSYYARRSPSPPRQGSYLLRTLLAGAAIWVVPSLVFAPGVLGSVPYDAGLGVLVASAVNIHHFVLDGAIWKLRDGRIARVLLRGQPEDDAPAPAAARRGWMPRMVWTAGAVSAGLLLLTPLEQVFGLATSAQRASTAIAAGDFDRAVRDLERVETAAGRLRWVGRESATARVSIAMMHQRLGNDGAAERHAEAARRLASDHVTLANLAAYYQRNGKWHEALEATRAAWAQQPESPSLQDKLAWLLVRHDGADADVVAEAVRLAERAVAATGRANARYLHTLGLAYAAAGRLADALRAAEDGLARARADGDGKLEQWIAEQAAGYRAALDGR